MEKKKTTRELVEELVAEKTGFASFCQGCIGEELDGECDRCFELTRSRLVEEA